MSNDQPVTLFEKMLEQGLADEDFRREFDLYTAEIETVDGVINALDDARIELGMSKAELARRIGMQPAAVRRLLGRGRINPTLATVAKAAHGLGLRIRIDPS